MTNNKVTWSYFENEILPTVKAVDGDLKKSILAHLEAKAITVVDEQGNEIDLNATLVVHASKMEDEDEVKMDGDHEDDKEDEAKAADIQRLVSKAVSDALKTQKPEAPKAKGITIDNTPSIHGTCYRMTPKNFKGKHSGKSADERAYRFGMWALSTIGKQVPRYAGMFPKADEYAARYIAKAAQAEDVNYLGGSLVPEEFGVDIIDLRETYGVARKLFKIRPMSSDTRTDPRRAGGLTSYFVGENSQGTESNKLWDEVRLTAKKLMVLARISGELNEDAVISLGDDLAGEIAYAFSNKEDDCAFNGDGTSTYGKIVGVRTSLNDAAGNPTTTSAGGVIVGAGNAYSELTLANFESVAGVLPQYADTGNTTWVAHRKFYYEVMLRLELAQGGSTAKEASEGSRGERPLFLGYPVTFSQVMPSTADNSQVCALLGDFTLGASFGDRRGTAISFSEHATVNGESVFEYDQIAVRGTERFDINVHDTGTSSAAGPIVGLQTLNS